MTRSDYAEALLSLLDAGNRYWLDAAYVAERILTLDELGAFIKEHMPAKPVEGGEEGAAYERDYFGSPPDPERALRLLLARRQLREEKFDAALESFRNDDFALDEEHASLAAVANEYVSAVRGSTSAWTGVARATELFKAAQLAKQFGMELMGYELAPDYAAFKGRVELGRLRQLEEGPYVSADEVSRAAANAPPEARFHYRGIALDLAKRSADNLPARSHAFAAVLCTSLRWARSNGDGALAKAIYQRYVREGAYVGWSEKFGGRCEAPDFPRATSLLWHTRIHAARVAVRPYKIPLIVLVTGTALGLGVFAARRYQGRVRRS
jgi:hypothetical protein